MSKKISPTLGQYAEWKKDRLGRYISANEIYAEIAGLDSPHSIVGKTDDDMPWRDLADFFRAGDQLVMNGIGSERVLVHEKEISVYGELDILVTESQLILPSSGEIVGVTGSFTDITGHKIVENEAAGHYDIGQKKYFLPIEFGEGSYLTQAQARVLQKTCQGGSAKHIAHELGIKEKTVYSHIDAIKKKLGASSKSDLAVIANEHGIYFELLDVKSLLIEASDTS